MVVKEVMLGERMTTDEGRGWLTEGGDELGRQRYRDTETQRSSWASTRQD